MTTYLYTRNNNKNETARILSVLGSLVVDQEQYISTYHDIFFVGAPGEKTKRGRNFQGLGRRFQYGLLKFSTFVSSLPDAIRPLLRRHHERYS